MLSSHRKRDCEFHVGLRERKSGLVVLQHRISRTETPSGYRCKQCRSAKIKCSGTAPCARCARRREHCVFPSDEPHVSVPQTYLEHLERRVAQQSKSRQRSSPSDFTNASIRPAEEAPQDASRGLLVLGAWHSYPSCLHTHISDMDRLQTDNHL